MSVPPAGKAIRPWYETLAQSLGLVALLLPLDGAVVRFVALQIAGIDVPLDLATRVPIGQLTVTGLNALTLAIPFLGYYGFAWLISREFSEHRGTDHRNHEAVRQQLRPVLRWALILLIPIAAGMLFLPDWPLSMMLGFLFPGFIAIERYLAVGRKLTFSSFWPRILYVSLAASLLAGLGGFVAGVQPAAFSFTPSEQPVVSDGSYIDVGSQDSIRYLVSCSSPSVAIAVPEAQIIAVRYRQPVSGFGPNAWAFLTGKTSIPLGLSVNC